MLSLDVIHRSGNPTQNSPGKRSRMMANHSTVDNSVNVQSQKSIENWSVWSKMALREVGVSLPQ